MCFHRHALLGQNLFKCCLSTSLFSSHIQVTYKNLETWYAELQEHCKGIPTIVVANKIDVDYKVRVHALGLCFVFKLIPSFKLNIVLFTRLSRSRVRLTNSPMPLSGDFKKLQLCCQAQTAILLCIGIRWDQRGQDLSGDIFSTILSLDLYYSTKVGLLQSCICPRPKLANRGTDPSPFL